jgi:hypothetical protein
MYTQVWDAMTKAPSTVLVERDADKAIIPFDDGNRDYRDYKAWLEAGNEPSPATPPPEVTGS